MTAVHGGLDVAELRRLGLRAEQVLDFSANINPLGTSPRVLEAAANADLSAYPDRHCLELREALAARLRVDINSILVGNGTVQLIHLIARAFLGPGKTCLIFGPTFGEYEEAASIAGGEIRFQLEDESEGFRWRIEDAVQAIGDLGPDVVFLCNPNNPTGVYLTPDEVGRIRDSMAGNGLLVLDDSYAELSDGRWDALSLLDRGSIVVLRSMTKAHALAGVRLGYMAGEPEVISATARLQPAWSVNAVAQAAGVAALADNAHVVAAREVIAEAKALLCEGLKELGVPVSGSATNFVLARVGDGVGVRGGLLERRIAVRDCGSFGLPEYIRIAVRRPEECQRLIEALGEGLANG